MEKNNGFSFALLLVSFMIIYLILFVKENAEVKSRVYSHRGASGEATEHTFQSYDLAIKHGSKFIEADIVLSKDSKIYISHDLSSYRLTGVDRLYSQMTSEEIENLRTSDGQKILSLEEMFERYGKAINYVIELKSQEKNLVNEFCKTVNEYKYKDIIIVQSARLEVLKELEKEFPDMPKLFLSCQDNIYDALKKDYIDIISVDKWMMTQEYCDLVHSYDKEFNVYTLNTEADIKTACELGVDSYFTDYTSLAFDIEKRVK